jgi:hypothetical protein
LAKLHSGKAQKSKQSMHQNCWTKISFVEWSSWIIVIAQFALAELVFACKMGKFCKKLRMLRIKIIGCK